jgi:hypothetical protein
LTVAIEKTRSRRAIAPEKMKRTWLFSAAERREPFLPDRKRAGLSAELGLPNSPIKLNRGRGCFY